MTECPDQACHERVTQMGNSMKAYRAALWAVIVVIGIPVAIVGIRMWANDDAAALRFAAAQEVQAIEKRVTISEIHFKTMCDNITEIKTAVLAIQQDVKRLDGHDRMPKMQ